MLDRLKADIKTSLLAGDRFRAETLKFVFASMQNARIAKGLGAVLDETECIAVMQKEIKKRKESITMYRDAGATEKAQKEQDEQTILSEYVPAMLEGKHLLDAIESFLSSKDVKSLSFSDAMKDCISSLGNVDKGQLAVILKQKLSA
jgi:uncharacterized protein